MFLKTDFYLNFFLYVISYFISFLLKIFFYKCVGFCHVTINHNYTCIPSLLSLPPLPHPTPLYHQRVPGWAPCVIQQLFTSCLFYTGQCVCMLILLSPFIPLCCTATFHQLSILHRTVCMYVDATFSIHPTVSLPHYVHKSIHYICVSVPSLQIGSSVQFF